MGRVSFGAPRSRGRGSHALVQLRDRARLSRHGAARRCPRVHPICPILTDDHLYGLVVPGPKLNDLRRDGRFALHSETLPPPHQDDGFYLTGVAAEVTDAPKWEQVATQMLAERELEIRWPNFETQVLFEFLFDRCLLTPLPNPATVFQLATPSGSMDESHRLRASCRIRPKQRTGRQPPGSVGTVSLEAVRTERAEPLCLRTAGAGCVGRAWTDEALVKSAGARSAGHAARMAAGRLSLFGTIPAGPCGRIRLQALIGR